MYENTHCSVTAADYEYSRRRYFLILINLNKLVIICRYRSPANTHDQIRFRIKYDFDTKKYIEFGH